jgi:steroid 5-alpha reductase family enzyme
MSTTKTDLKRTTIVVIIVTLIVSLISISVDVNSVNIFGYSAIIVCAISTIGIQLLAWIPASILKTEKFYDMTGGFTYIAIVFLSLWTGSQYEAPSVRELIVSILVVIWAIRLSSFLYLRIHRVGKDGRFDELKKTPTRFLVPWIVQGLWVFLTMNVVIVINTQSNSAPPLGIWDFVALIIWVLGFSIEVIADSQKTKFNMIAENKGKWIQDGLWSMSRHPNYFGEILVWTGIAFFGISCFSGLEMISWISPIFVYLLLTKISGIPILDRRALEKWGKNPDYLSYRDKTPQLIPKLSLFKR